MQFSALFYDDSEVQAESLKPAEKNSEPANTQTGATYNTSTGDREEMAVSSDTKLLLLEDKLILSHWTNSAFKRLFDCFCVILALPFVLPVLAVTAIFVRLTSHGPVLFIQERVGLHGETFRILKFRTMEHRVDRKRNAVTSANNQKFTPVGPFLRRFKLDELPQLLNVLKGDMSLVGPRPKMPEHVKSDLPCRPGITGYATLTFAREELVFSRLPREKLEAFYHDVVLPTKRRMDERYMGVATLWSDLELIYKTVTRDWDASHLNRMVENYLNRVSEEKVVFFPVKKVHVAASPVSANPLNAHSRRNTTYSAAAEEAGAM